MSEQIIKGVAQAIQQNNEKLRGEINEAKKSIRNDLIDEFKKDWSHDLIKDYKSGKAYSIGELVRYKGALFQAFQETDYAPNVELSGWACIVNAVNELSLETPSLRERVLRIEMADGNVKEFVWKEPIPVHKGVFESGTAYDEGDEVIAGGSTFRSLEDNNTTEPATDECKWLMIAQRGKSGKVGMPGERGENGLIGEKGEKGDSGKDADVNEVANIVMRAIISELKGVLKNDRS